MRSALLIGLAMAAICLIGVSPLSAKPTCQSDIVDFTAAGTFANGSALSGNLDIDIGCGLLESEDLSVSDFGVPFTDAGTAGFESNSTWGPIGFAEGAWTLSVSIDLSGQTNTNSLIGYLGGNLCTSADNCNNGSGTDYVTTVIPPGQFPGFALTSGTLTNPNATPEPSSFLLMVVPGLWFAFRGMRRRA